MKFLALLICSINSWNALLCCCAGKVDAAEQPACHKTEMSCHQNSAPSETAANETGNSDTLLLHSQCRCREHRARNGRDFLNTRVESGASAEPAIIGMVFFASPEKRVDIFDNHLWATHNNRIDARGAPDLAVLSRFLI